MSGCGLVPPTNALTPRSAQPRISEENAQVIFEKGRGIQQDFADSFTGTTIIGHMTVM